MEELLLSSALYNKVFDEGFKNCDKLLYSCIPLEIAHIETLRKQPAIQVSQLKCLCSSLDNVPRIPLEIDDLTEAMEDDEYLKNNFGARKNPYYLAALTAIEYHKDRWWNESILSQFHEAYD